MKQLLQNLGIILIVIATLILVITTLGNEVNNFPLGVSAALFIVGLLTHIFVNKRIA